MGYKEKDRQKQAQHESYLRNRDKVREQSKKQREARKQWVSEQKNTPCLDCGQSFPPIVMDFHHRDSEEKIMEVSTAISRMSMKEIAVEIAKCDLVCANCHRLRHLKARCQD